MNNKLSCVGALMALLVLVTLFLFGMLKEYQVDRDIDSLINRAQVSADSGDMLLNMQMLQHNMEVYGMTQGHGALFFTTPMTDFNLTYKAVNRIIERLAEVEKMPKNEVAYQVALDDIRGTIRELPNPGDMYMWVHYWWIQILLCACVVVFGIFGGFDFE